MQPGGGRREAIAALSAARARRASMRRPMKVVLECQPTDQPLQGGDACLVLRQDDGGRLVTVERSRLVRGDPDLDLVPAEAVTSGKSMRRLTSEILLDNLTLELDRVDAMLGHGLSP